MNWYEYTRSCYDLVMESEGATVILEHEIEAYVVHMMARYFDCPTIGERAMAIVMMEAMQNRDREKYLSVGDECLLIYSYPLKKQRWPSATYYRDLGTTAYGMAGHIMERHFVPASQVITGIFNKHAYIS